MTELYYKLAHFKNYYEYFGIETSKDNLADFAFITDINESLFSQIDSTLDYYRDPDRGLSGHMLWFNTDHKHYYCFQPAGKPLSEQVIIEMNGYKQGSGIGGGRGVYPPGRKNFENTPPPEDLEKIYPPPRRGEAPPPFFWPNFGN